CGQDFCELGLGHVGGWSVDSRLDEGHFVPVGSTREVGEVRFVGDDMRVAALPACTHPKRWSLSCLLRMCRVAASPEGRSYLIYVAGIDQVMIENHRLACKLVE